MPRPGLSGGTKSNRLIAEAMQRRGHRINMAFITALPPWPSPLRIRRFARRAVNGVRAALRPAPHHMMFSSTNLIPINRQQVRSSDVPDADVTIATWWATMEWVQHWPARKGIHAYFIRHYETFGGDPARVDATYRAPSLKLCIATWLQRLMAEKFNDPTARLVPNGVDRSQFDAPPRGKQPTPTVGVVYSDSGWKGIDTAFAAIRLAQRRLPRLKVICFGSSCLKAIPLPPENMHFEKRPAQMRIPQLYRMADVWIMSSTSEGFGMPGLEAAACRCPVVSTRCGGPEDYVVDGQTGYLVPVGDHETMAERLLEVLELSDGAWRQMSEASYLKARSFDWDHSAELMEQALLERLG